MRFALHNPPRAESAQLRPLDLARLSSAVYREDPTLVESRRRNSVIQNYRAAARYQIERFGTALIADEPNAVIVSWLGLLVAGVIGPIAVAGIVAHFLIRVHP